jgi:surface protein
MYCFKCGKEVVNNSEFCSHCGAKLVVNKQASYTKFIVVALIVAGVGFGGLQWYANYKINNPVLNTPSDISDELIQKIITNSIASLTINYEFTRCQQEGENSKNWKKVRLAYNPFWIANQQHELTSIDFEVKLSPNVHSLACAFRDFRNLRYVNIKDTSNVTSMAEMFKDAKSFNQPIGNWRTHNVTDMREMFSWAESFNQPINSWNIYKVTDMSRMFFWATSFNQPITWNISKVKKDYMFHGAESYSYPKPLGVK